MGDVLEVLDLDFPAAGPWLKKATLLNPSMAHVHRNYGQYLSRMGQFEEAEDYLREAAHLDPASPIPWYNLGLNDLWRGNYEQAKDHFEKALTLQPDYRFARRGLAEVYLAQGKTQAVLQEVEVNLSPWSLAILSRAYARAGRPDSARVVLRRLREQFGPSPYTESTIYAALGETALDVLEEAGGTVALKVGPHWAPLRGEPRYERLLEEMGLDDASVRETMERLHAMDRPAEGPTL